MHSEYPVPFQVYNGYLTAAPNRANPTTDLDHSGREFRNYAEGSGAYDVQLLNGTQRRAAMGQRIPWVTYLYAAGARIPGQLRDNYGGNVNVGPGPLEYQTMVRNTAGSQPQNPGGVRQFAADTFYNPGTS